MTERSVRVLQKTSVAIALLAVPAMFALVALTDVDRVWPGHVASAAVLLSILLLGLSPLLGPAQARGRLARVAIIWMWASALTHLTWELGWCLAHPYLHGVTGDDLWAWAFWTYGIADGRYLISDPFVVAIEWGTVILGTPLNAIVLTLLVKRQERRAAFFVVVVSVMELYGTVLYFATALFNGFAHIDTSSAWNLGVKFIGLNGLWVLFPALAIRAAFRDLLPAGAAARARQATATR